MGSWGVRPRSGYIAIAHGTGRLVPATVPMNLPLPLSGGFYNGMGNRKLHTESSCRNLFPALRSIGQN